MKLFSDGSQPAIMKDALLALINLSSLPSIALQLSKDEETIIRIIKCTLDHEYKSADMMSSILSNITRTEEAAEAIVEIIARNQNEVGLDKLIVALCTVNYNKHAKLNYLASVLSNLTQHKQARLFVLNKKQCVVQRLLPFVDYSESLIRRGGVIATLHNCCFETGK